VGGKNDDLVGRINNDGISAAEAIKEWRGDGVKQKECLDFSNQNLNSVDFTGADLRGVSFRKAVLCYANFTEAILEGADFGGADLTDTIGLSTTSGLLKANFVGARLNFKDQKAILAMLEASFLDGN